ncbi:MAG: glycosyltransferase [Butyrivibrio sp.]|nr:glycosyltransferase [Butyrivibrio sp.]
METILILIPRFGVGGISKIGAFIANTLSEEYTVVLTSLIPDEATCFISERVIRTTLSYDFTSKRDGALIQLYDKAGVLTRLRKTLIEYKVNLICSLGLDLGKIALLASAGLPCKCLSSERGNPYRYSKKQRFQYDIVVRKSDAIVFQTQMAMDAFPKCAINGKAFIIQNPAIGRNTTTYHVGKVDERRKRIIYCGRLSREKNIDMLIKAYSAINTNDYRLIIYGDGPEYSHLKRLIEEKDLLKTVEIIRNCDDVFAKEADSEIFVLTSNEEGMPNALIEAMMCGMACIVTDSPPGGCRELLLGGKRGILIPVNDDKSLTDALESLIKDSEKIKCLGEAAKTICQTNSVEVIQKKWIEVVRSLV